MSQTRSEFLMFFFSTGDMAIGCPEKAMLW